MAPLSSNFSSPVHLPFNSSSLKGRFHLRSPDGDPGGNGFWVVLRGTELVVTEDGCLPEGEVPEEFVSATDSMPLYFGDWEGKPCRAVVVPTDHPFGHRYVAENLLASDPVLPIELLSLGGLAKQVLHWERNSRFCSCCGGNTDRLPGEWGRKCLSCGYAHFPHIHPCVIVLVRRHGEVLLTRKAEWPTGRYSLVAGFLDFGECLEEAVCREVMEETGVRVKNIRYVGSQSWPFPSQLMAGFVAEYAGGEVRVDERELEDACWFRVDDLPLLPPRRSIARYLLDNFLCP